MCKGEDCLVHFKIGKDEIMIPFAFALFLCIFVVVFGVWIFDCFIRCGSTRYRPRPLWCFNAVFIAPFTIVPFLTYCQFFALRDYCFGGAKFIPTKRSPSSSQDKLNMSGASLANASNPSLPSMANLPSVTEAISENGPNGLGLAHKTLGG